jgi:hypothetical protein
LGQSELPKQQGAKQYRLSTAGRVDAYGDEQVYDPATNTWKINLSPTQNQIINAGQKEQLQSLTHDAVNNRILRDQAFDRAEAAQPMYRDAVAGFQYDQPDSEGAIANKQLDALRIGEQQATNANRDVMSLQALRLGRGAISQKIMKTANDSLGQSLGKDIVSAQDNARNIMLNRCSSMINTTCRKSKLGNRSWQAIPQRCKGRALRLSS